MSPRESFADDDAITCDFSVMMKREH